MMTTKRRFLVGFVLSLCTPLGSVADEQRFSLIGVSGTLQDGFELRNRLDYHPCENGKDRGTSCADGSSPVPAKFVGKALVRGYKAYLDVKPQGWREYKDVETGPPQVPNPVVLATGCFQDANVYHLYLVAPQQVLKILAGEPRFLAITPDTGLIDLTADETSDAVRRLAAQQIATKLGDSALNNQTAIAVPLVTGTWFDATSFVESPVVYVKDDGTRVTSFDESLALWAGVDRSDLLLNDNSERGKHAWKDVLDKVRATECDDSSKANFPVMCHNQVRFGVSKNHLRLNYPLTQEEIVLALATDLSGNEL